MIKNFPEFHEFKDRLLNDGVMLHLFGGENTMLSVVDFEPHSIVPDHSHPHEQMGMVLEGEFEFTIDGETRTVRDGDFYRVPPNVVHSVKAGDCPARALDIFSPPREDYMD